MSAVTLSGGGGNDTMKGGGSGDLIVGDNKGALYPGTDTVDYTDKGSSGVTLTMANDVADDGVGGVGEGDNVASDIENVLLGNGANDVSVNALNNSIVGGSGNDTINGGGGEDTIYGNNGNDVLVGGSQNDHLWGGLGLDYLDGGAHDDRIHAHGDPIADADTIFGGTGYDRLHKDSADSYNADVEVPQWNGI